jgi:hypothetical protein
MIQAQMADGTILQFPEGTPDAVVDKAASDYIGSSKAPTSTWNPVGDELGNIYTPSPSPSLGDMREAVWQPTTRPAAPVDPSAPPGPLAAPVGGEFGDLSAQPWAQGEPVPEGKVAPAAKIANAAVEGWRDTPSIMTPEGEDALNKLGPLFRQVINPGLKILNVPIAAGNALMQGFAEGANQVTGDARVGRDVMAALNTLPFIQAGKLPGPRAPVPEPPSPRFVPERFAPDVSELDPRNAIKTLIQHDIEENPRIKIEGEPERKPEGWGEPNQSRAAPPLDEFNRTEPPPAPPAEPPDPGSVGAAASREGTPASEIGLTPAEEAAYRSTAEGEKLLEPQEPGFRDDKQYLPGEIVNEAEASQDVLIARELKSLRQQTPELDAKMTRDETHNRNIQTNAINNAIPGRVQIVAAEKARKAAMEAAEPEVFANATAADPLPIVKEIQDILNDPKNKENSQLRQYVKPLIERLQNPDGTPKITNPLQLWSWRQDVQHLTSGAAKAADPNLSRVSGMLGRVLDVTDDRIEAAAPGYQARLRDEYRTRSREIDAMEALNAERFKLYDSQNVPNYNAIQSLMRRIIDARQGNDPYEPFTHVTNETLGSLFNIRDSMRRSRAADRLAAPKGSPTAQNLGDALRGAGKMALQTAAPAVGAGIGLAMFPGMPSVGSTIGIGAGAMVNHLLSERGMRQRMTRGLELTNPNRLMHPLP